MGIQNFGLIYSFLSSYAVATEALISFCTLCKNFYKMQTCTSIALIFGTNEEHVMVDSRTTFVVNLRNIQGVMSVYSHKKIKLLSRLQGKLSIEITCKLVCRSL